MELKHAILGLLTIRPMSGYDLGRVFEGSVAHFWHADRSQIYRTIDRLSADRMIDTEVIAQAGKPDRKVHSIADAGSAELHNWLTSPLEVDRPKIPLLARMFFIAPLGASAVEHLLDEATAQADEELAELRAIEIGPVSDIDSVLRSATLNYGVEAGEAKLRWLRETRKRLDAVKGK